MSIFNDGNLVDVNVSFWSGAKVLTAEDLGLEKNKVPEAFKLGRKMLIPKEVAQKFRRIESKARRLVEENSFHFPIGNARFIPFKKFKSISDRLKKCQEEYNALVEDLITNYEAYRNEMIPIYRQAAEQAFFTQEPSTQEFSIEAREGTKEAFVEAFMNRINAYYPDANSLRSKFSLTWDVYEIALPRMAKKNEAAEEEYRAQAQKKIGGFIDEVVNSLRRETIEICNKITGNIKEGKIVKSRTLTSLKDFIEKFSDLNFVGDVKIESQLAKLKAEFLDTLDQGKDLQSDAEPTVELGRRLHELSQAAADMNDVNSVTGEYRRKITW